MSLARHLLTAPHGAPGSARARYAAAMTLHAEGALSDAALEAYREAAAFDALDPGVYLRDRGLAVPEAQPMPQGLILQHLGQRIDRLLAATGGEGAAEVRPLLARALAAPPRAVVAQPPPLMLLALALAQVADAELAMAICAAAPLLCWETYDLYDPAQIGAAFARGHAYATLAGASGPFAARDFDLGLFVIAPRTLYRDRAHAAPELYLPLTGPHRWRFAPGAAWHEKPALAPVWNPAHQPHATLTGDVPLLTLFAWTRDVDEPAYVLPAGDWARWEG